MAWVVHVRSFDGGVVVEEEDMGSGGAVRVKGGKVSHGFVFRSKTFVEGIRYLFGDLAEVIDIVMAFVDSCHADASGRVDERMVSVSG